MIRKVITISNVGKLRKCVSHGDTTFKKLNLIFGENAQGKTTLSSILRSLTTGNAEYILGRETLHKSDSDKAHVHIHIDGTQHIFDGRLWNKTNLLPKIEIFDESFVVDNVYSGCYIDPIQRENLLQFIVGEEGVEYAEAIAQLSIDIKNANDRLTPLREKLREKITGSLDVDRFIELPNEDEVDEKIEKKKTEQASFVRRDEINCHSLLKTIGLPKLELDEINKILSTTVEVIADNAEETLLSHIGINFDKEGKEWIEKGLKYVTDNSCPFCGQSLTGIGLIIDYRAFFNDSYKEFKNSITVKMRYLEETVTDTFLLGLLKDVNSNNQNSLFWKKYTQIEIDELDFDQIRSRLTVIRDLLVKNLEKKIGVPLEQIAPPKELLDASRSYAILLSDIEGYNNSTSAANELIKNKKSALLAHDTSSIEKELERLLNAKMRHSPEVASICTDYINAKKAKDVLEKRIKKETDNLKKYTSAFLQNYKDNLNHYLQVFGADFQICNVTDKYYTRTPRLEYCISINGVDVDLGNEKKDEVRACFRNTLSSGDKTTLAFALFVSRLMNDGNIGSKIVVFDDPISSLDDHRKNCTAQIIRDLSKRARQVVILSHNPFFLRTVWESFDKDNVKTLTIQETSDGSCIEEWDMVKETRSEYFKAYDDIHDFVNEIGNANSESIAQKIRILLEGNLKARFPHHLRSCNELGSMISVIRDERQNCDICSDYLLNELTDINEYSRKHHHTDIDKPNTLQINKLELKTFAKRTLNLLNTF